MITHLETGILECEVKWALRSITMNTASGGDGIPVELSQILKNDQPRQHIKSRDITLPTKVHLVKAMFFPVMYGCESWTINKADC